MKSSIEYGIFFACNNLDKIEVVSKFFLDICNKNRQDTEESEEQCVINDSNGLSGGLDSMSLECS